MHEKHVKHMHKTNNNICFRTNTTNVNVGSYYYKHRDTDSEVDTMDSIKSVPEEIPEEAPQKDDSTDDEFTYSPGIRASSPINNTNETDSEAPTQESIQLLVQRADELVATPSRVDPFMFQSEHQKHKLSRVKEWLNFDSEDKPSDSCDASGECTSGESDEDRDSHSQSSEDLNESVITCRPQLLNHSSSLDHTTNSNATFDVLDVSASSDFVKVFL